MTLIERYFNGYDELPETLRNTPQWVCWQYIEREDSKSGKLPIDPETGRPADISSPDAGTSLAHAVHYYEDQHPIGRTDVLKKETDGIGFVFTSSDPFIGIDLDDCITSSDSPETWAKRIVESLDSYIEYSPSGNGLHCICEGTLLDGNGREGQVEMYEEDRFFTVTAAPIPELDTHSKTSNATLELAEIYGSFIRGDDEDEEPTTADNSSQTTVTTGGGGNSLSDSELLEKARAASNSDKFERLWNGNTRGYPSQSEADLALCTFLVYWSDEVNRSQIDRLFRRSQLYRDKWDEQRGDSTYGQLTIDKAISVTE